MAKRYPQIRVFVSSTFLDMQKEREILNLEVFPVVKGVCDRLGVAFNVIDLRWGITQEDQAGDSVIDLCLEEIRHCRPYFIGLIGNRYGWIPDSINPDVTEKFPFIKENTDKSVTEMEMILGALSQENRDRCFFYYKDASLFDPATADHQETRIEVLKEQIGQKGIRHSDYASFQAFREAVEKDLLEAIRADFPQEQDLTELRQEAYLNLVESGHVKRPMWAFQAFDLITFARERHQAVAAVSPTPLGKTTTFNHLVNNLPDADKIIVNFEADAPLRYFPAHYLHKLIGEGLKKLGYALEDSPVFPEPDSLNNYESATQAMLTLLKKALYNLRPKRPLYILINDANLFFRHDRSKVFQRFFLFDEQPLPEGLTVIITTDEDPEPPILCAPMQPSEDDPKAFFVNYLAGFGKKLDQEILDAANKRLTFADYKLIGQYLIYYCNFSNYRESARELLATYGGLDTVTWVYDSFVASLPPKLASVFTEILLRLYFFLPGMPERELFASYQRETALEETEYQVYVDLSEVEKAAVMRALRYFTSVESGTVYIREKAVRNFIAQRIGHLAAVLQQTAEERSRSAYEYFFNRQGGTDYVVKDGRILKKEDFVDSVIMGPESRHLMEYAVLDPLCAWADKTLAAYASELMEFSPLDLTDREAGMLLCIQEAAEMYRADTRADLYAKLLGNVPLMVFVSTKSHALLKRLIEGYIQLNVKLQQRQCSHVDKRSVAFALNYALEPVLKADGDQYPELFLQDIVDTAILVAEEQDYLDDELQQRAENGEGAIPTIDFAVNACTEAVREDLYDIDYDMDYGEPDDVLQWVPELYKRLQESENGFDRMLYAYYLFKGSAKLLNSRLMPEELFDAVVPGAVQAVRELRRYCFFPEITAVYDDFLSHLG